MKLRENTYLTFYGLVKFLDLGDSVYGEWIICQNNTPNFYVSLFDDNNESNRLLKQIMESGEGIEFILNKINNSNNLNLSFQRRPPFEFEIRTKLIEIDLEPFPLEWIKNAFNN